MHDSQLFAPARQPEKKSLAVLIVDDNTMNRTLASRMLATLCSEKNLTVSIDQADNGLKAVELIESRIHKQHENYDFILMDNEMPVMLGTEATLVIRRLEIENDIASMDCSYIASWSSTHHEKFEGADTALKKPLQKAELQNALNTVHSQKFGDYPSPPRPT